MLLLIVKADMYICSNSICLLAHLPNATETPRAPVQNNYGDLFQNYSTSVEASACNNRYDAFIRIHICVRFEPQACTYENSISGLACTYENSISGLSHINKAAIARMRFANGLCTRKMNKGYMTEVAFRSRVAIFWNGLLMTDKH